MRRCAPAVNTRLHVWSAISHAYLQVISFLPEVRGDCPVKNDSCLSTEQAKCALNLSILVATALYVQLMDHQYLSELLQLPEPDLPFPAAQSDVYRYTHSVWNQDTISQLDMNAASASLSSDVNPSEHSDAPGTIQLLASKL